MGLSFGKAWWLRDAVVRGDLKEMERLLADEPALLDAVWVCNDGSRESALVAAVESRRSAAVLAQLLALGADPNLVVGWDDTTALHSAGARPDPGALRILLDAGGADIDARDRDGRTPLYHAVLARRAANVELLLARGADVGLGAWSDGKTPLHLAVGRKGKSSEALVEALVQGGADPSARDRSGRTCLDALHIPFINVGAAWPLKRAIRERQRPSLLLKARSCAHAERASRVLSRLFAAERLPLQLQQHIWALVAPFRPLNERLVNRQVLPRVEIAPARLGEESELLVACVEYALGLGEHGGQGMPSGVFVELLDYLVPTWDPARKGEPLGAYARLW